MPDTPRGERQPSSLQLEGKPLQAAQDVSRFLGLRHSRLVYILYKAPDDARYTHFEIPKRTGGMRPIASPNGLLREAQYKLLPHLKAAYEAHPAAHGFVDERSIVSNAAAHADKRWVFNVDLEGFFPSINFGRIRGLFMASPFNLGAAAATVCAQICTYRNGLPQGAPTSPVLSNFIATPLDRRLRRLARERRLDYSRFADDLTFSTDLVVFPPDIAIRDGASGGQQARCGESLERAIAGCGFAVNHGKVRLQGRSVHQSVTGLCVNRTVNVERTRIRRLRAMLHAWEKFGLEAAGAEHFRRYAGLGHRTGPDQPARAFRNLVYGHLSFVKMVRGAADPLFLKLCSKLITLDPTPSRFVRQMAFGAADYEVFISHASEDKAAVARPIFEACERLGLKAFLDEEHIAWGESFTTKINTALGAARTVLAIVSPVSVAKEWPVIEVNTALSLEVSGKKQVVPLIVGKPDLTRLPLIAGKDWLEWSGDAEAVARALRDAVRGKAATASPPQAAAPAPVVAVAAAPPPPSPSRPARRRGSWLGGLFGRKP
jgi:RNA-directed DNA polymerase